MTTNGAASPLESVAQASRWIDASGIPVYPAEAVRAWLDRLGVPVPLGIQALLAEIRRGLIAAGDAGYAAGCAQGEAAEPQAVLELTAERDQAVASLRDVLAELKDRTAEARGARSDYEELKGINAVLGDRVNAYAHH